MTWSRDDGLLPEDAILGEGILIIPSAKIQDAGTYTCMATNEAGSVSSKFVLYVKGEKKKYLVVMDSLGIYLHYSKTCLKWPLKEKTKNWFSRPILT